MRDFGDLPRVDPRRGSSAGSLVEQVERAGLRGRGGGWFPTATKLRAVVESSAARNRWGSGRHPVVIANAMEGEPASSKDAVLLSASPHLVLDGVSLSAATVRATDVFVAVHRNSPLIPGLIAALEERHLAGRDRVPIRLVTPPGRYVASEESALAHWVGSGTATPTHLHRPFQRGASGRPTLVQNVETLAHLALVARYSGAWYAGEGVPNAPGTTLVTVGGAVARPGVLEVSTGTRVAELVERCGGATGGVLGYLTGGYGGAWVRADGFDRTPWDPDSVRDAGGVLGASVLWLVEEGVCPLHDVARVAAWMAGESAGQCGPCVFGLPSIAGDMRLLADRLASAAEMTRLERRLGLVRNRGGCKHPDGVSRFVATALAAFDDEVRLHVSGGCSASTSRPHESNALPVPAVPRLRSATAGQVR